MEGDRRERLAQELTAIAATFFERISNRQSLMTVTRTDISPDLANATVYFTVLPQTEEEQALSFVKRNAAEFRSFAREKTNTKRIPFFHFEIDEGEKNRQRIDELTR